jgi:hypothetical protein
VPPSSSTTITTTTEPYGRVKNYFAKMPGTETSHWKDDLFLKIINILVYFFFLGSNLYTVVSPKDVYYGSKETCEQRG